MVRICQDCVCPDLNFARKEGIIKPSKNVFLYVTKCHAENLIEAILKGVVEHKCKRSNMVWIVFVQALIYGF